MAKDELKVSLLFEIALAEITAPAEERRNATALYNPTTLGELPLLDGLPPSWTEYVQNLFHGKSITDWHKRFQQRFQWFESSHRRYENIDFRLH